MRKLPVVCSPVLVWYLNSGDSSLTASLFSGSVSVQVAGYARLRPKKPFSYCFISLVSGTSLFESCRFWPGSGLAVEVGDFLELVSFQAPTPSAKTVTPTAVITNNLNLLRFQTEGL